MLSSACTGVGLPSLMQTRSKLELRRFGWALGRQVLGRELSVAHLPDRSPVQADFSIKGILKFLMDQEKH
jgi:hypothetical protein